MLRAALLVAAASADVVVNTTSGRVRGAFNDSLGAWQFMGIPFAAPPVGDGASPPTKLATIASERALLTPGSMGRTPSMAPAATPGSVGRTPSVHRRKSAKSTGDLGGDDGGGATNFARRSSRKSKPIGERIGT